jgi:hypothetical protein
MDKELYLILANYRSANKQKDFKKGEKYFNFKKNMYAYGRPYKVDAQGATYGNMILVDEKYIIPEKFCRLLNEKERAYVESEYAKLQNNSNANGTDIEQKTEATEQADVELLNNQGKAAMSETTEKLKNMGIGKINNIKSGYVSTGVLFGGVGGLLLATFLRKSIWMSVGIVIGGMTLGGIVGNNFDKRFKKEKQTEKENQI